MCAGGAPEGTATWGEKPPSAKGALGPAAGSSQLEKRVLCR